MMLQLAQTDAAAPAPFRGAPPAALAAMGDALATETRLLRELAAVMRQQREAVASDDLQRLDDSVFATHRILVTLAEARRRRRSVNRLLGAPEEVGVHQLERVLGAAMTPALSAARDGLREAAGVLAGEVDVNRRVLADAMASSDSYVRTLYGTAGSPDGAVPSASAAPTGGVLLDRTI